MTKSDKKWIQHAIKPKNKGKLRRKVRAKYGKAGFTERGTIKVEMLRDMTQTGTPQEQKEAALALNLRNLNAGEKK